jgi:predicted ATPase/DNA-binding winged helix-turn-helix (wHTH) protein
MPIADWARLGLVRVDVTLALKAAGRERLTFGKFELAPAARALWRSGAPVKLGSRALDILIALASRPGEILSKDELTQLVWRGAFVDETAVRVSISAARKALGEAGERHIRTVPGRGYCFVPDIAPTTVKLASQPTDRRPLQPQRLPPQIGRIVGREAVVDALVQEVPRRRLLSLVGAGGIGKTTVAVATVARLGGAFDAVAFVDLAPIEDGDQMAAGTAAALGLNLRLQQDQIDEIAAAVEERQVLLLFDNCEHLVDTVAPFVEQLLGRAPGVTILATSRELLRAVGEWVHQLSPLEAPPNSSTLSAQEARSYSAVEMFEDRAAFALGGYQLGDADAPCVADICRRLDGIALAIELAAGRLAGLGIQGLASSLDDCFQILTHGRRTALPRHQTLRATLDWSYQLLCLDDQAALRRLSVFSGHFALDDAGAVIGHNQRITDVGDALTSLFDKSLVVAKLSGGTLQYSLLETTRAYAQDKLIEAGEADLYRRRHAEHIRAVFDKAQAEWDRRPGADWLQAYSGQLGNLRVALDWAFSSEGDGAIGAALTAAAAPLWFHLSLLDEGLARVERAITWLKYQPSPNRRLLMQLYAVSGWPQMRVIKGIPSGAAAWQETLALAVELHDVDYQLRGLWALWCDCGNRGAPAEALALANRFAALSERACDPEDRIIARRLRGHSLHHLGNFAGSRRETEQMLELYTAPLQRSHLVRFQYDQKLTAQIILARGLWLQGYADQALALVEEMIAEGLALDHTLTLAHTLSDAACFIALWAGDMALAARYTQMLRAHTTLHALDVWRTYADAFEGEILIRQGRAPEGIGPVKHAIRTLKAAGFVLYNTAFECVLAEGLLACGQSSDAHEIVAGAIGRCHGSGEAWCLPELLRIRALALAASDRLPEAVDVLEHGLGIAHAQAALAWELRLASALVGIEDSVRARDILRNVLGRVQEGFGTNDYLCAVARAGWDSRARRSRPRRS